MGTCEGVGASAQEFEDYGVAEGARSRTSWIGHLEWHSWHRLMRYARLVLWTGSFNVIMQLSIKKGPGRPRDHHLDTN